MGYKFSTVIVPAQDAPNARLMASAFEPGGINMWTSQLSASGNEPATHYISSGYIVGEFVDLCPNATWLQDEAGDWIRVNYYPGDPQAVLNVAIQNGVDITLSEIEGVFSRGDFSQQNGFGAIYRMGLSIVRPPEEV